MTCTLTPISQKILPETEASSGYTSPLSHQLVATKNVEDDSVISPNQHTAYYRKLNKKLVNSEISEFLHYSQEPHFYQFLMRSFSPKRQLTFINPKTLSNIRSITIFRITNEKLFISATYHREYGEEFGQLVDFNSFQQAVLAESQGRTGQKAVTDIPEQFSLIEIQKQLEQFITDKITQLTPQSGLWIELNDQQINNLIELTAAAPSILGTQLLAVYSKIVYLPNLKGRKVYFCQTSQQNNPYQFKIGRNAEDKHTENHSDEFSFRELEAHLRKKEALEKHFIPPLKQDLKTDSSAKWALEGHHRTLELMLDNGAGARKPECDSTPTDQQGARINVLTTPTTTPEAKIPNQLPDQTDNGNYAEQSEKFLKPGITANPLEEPHQAAIEPEAKINSDRNPIIEGTNRTSRQDLNTQDYHQIWDERKRKGGKDEKRDEAVRLLESCLKKLEIPKNNDVSLYLYALSLSELPVIPKGIKILHVAYNNLRELPEDLPPGIEELHAAHNNLRELPEKLPNSLHTITAEKNPLLKTIPLTLPSSLKEMNLRDCQIETLPDNRTGWPKGCQIKLHGNPLDKSTIQMLKKLDSSEATTFFLHDEFGERYESSVQNSLRISNYQASAQVSQITPTNTPAVKIPNQLPAHHYLLKRIMEIMSEAMLYIIERTNRTSKQDLNTPDYHQIWKEWKQKGGEDEKRDKAVRLLESCLEKLENPEHDYVLLYLSDLSLSELPVIPKGIKKLDASYNNLREIPEDLPSGIETLDFYSNEITKLPKSMPDSIKFMSFSHNKIAELPESLLISLKNLEVLYVTSNQLSKLPEKWPNSLRTIAAEKNPLLKTIPLTFPSSLKEMNLGDCKIKTLPDNRTGWPKGCKIKLHGNPLDKSTIQMLKKLDSSEATTFFFHDEFGARYESSVQNSLRIGNYKAAEQHGIPDQAPRTNVLTTPANTPEVKILNQLSDQNSPQIDNYRILDEKTEEYIRDNFTHEIDGYYVGSYAKDKKSAFRATFAPTGWVFSYAVKAKNNSFYANDIKLFQIKLLAEKKEFLIKLFQSHVR